MQPTWTEQGLSKAAVLAEEKDWLGKCSLGLRAKTNVK